MDWEGSNLVIWLEPKTQTWKQLLWNDKHVLHFVLETFLLLYFGLSTKGNELCDGRKSLGSRILPVCLTQEFKASGRASPKTVQSTF